MDRDDCRVRCCERSLGSGRHCSRSCYCIHHWAPMCSSSSCRCEDSFTDDCSSTSSSITASSFEAQGATVIAENLQEQSSGIDDVFGHLLSQCWRKIGPKRRNKFPIFSTALKDMPRSCWKGSLQPQRPTWKLWPSLSQNMVRATLLFNSH